MKHLKELYSPFSANVTRQHLIIYVDYFRTMAVIERDSRRHFQIFPKNSKRRLVDGLQHRAFLRFPFSGFLSQFPATP